MAAVVSAKLACSERKVHPVVTAAENVDCGCGKNNVEDPFPWNRLDSAASTAASLAAPDSSDQESSSYEKMQRSQFEDDDDDEEDSEAEEAAARFMGLIARRIAQTPLPGHKRLALRVAEGTPCDCCSD